MWCGAVVCIVFMLGQPVQCKMGWRHLLPERWNLACTGHTGSSQAPSGAICNPEAPRASQAGKMQSSIARSSVRAAPVRANRKHIAPRPFPQGRAFSVSVKAKVNKEQLHAAYEELKAYINSKACEWAFSEPLRPMASRYTHCL